MHGYVSYRFLRKHGRYVETELCACSVASGRALSLRSDRALVRAQSLRSDRAMYVLGRYIATEFKGELGRYVATELR